MLINVFQFGKIRNGKSYKVFSVRHEEKDLPKQTLHTPKILFSCGLLSLVFSQKVISLHLKVK